MTDPDAPASPFAMEEYSLPGRSAEDADRRAENAFAESVEANERGDNYTLLTARACLGAVLRGHVRAGGAATFPVAIVGMALSFFVMAATYLATFPRRI